MEKTILNIAAGKFEPIGISQEETVFLVNLDIMYYDHTDVAVIEKEYDDWTQLRDKIFYCAEDAVTFMERTRMMFDKVCIYRFLEHVSFTNVQYFIYLLSTITTIGSWLDIIVPNYKILAQNILDENINDVDFESKNIELTTELLNEPSCPHASIWTPARARHFFGLEGRFRVEDVIENYEFDGRNIYMRFWAKRI